MPCRRGKELYWDVASMKFTNDDEANRHLQEPYRAGGTLCDLRLTNYDL